MTDPRGRWFVSYKRENSDRVGTLASALHEHGIPTWLDTENPKSQPTDDATRAAIRHAETAGAILFATGLVASSDAIRLVEAPEILGRWRRDPSFGVVPVISGGLNYEDAGQVYGDSIADHDLSLWNIYKARDVKFSDLDARAVSQRILEARLSALHGYLPPNEPISIALYTRERPHATLGRSLSIDWSHCFDPRHCSALDWSDRLLPTLDNVAKAVRRQASGRTVIAEGLLGIPAAFALGACFSTTRGVRIYWRQGAADTADQLWGLDAPAVAATIQVKSESRTLGAKDLAVLVSVTGDVREDFARTVKAVPPLRCIVDVLLSPPSRRITGAEAAMIARATSDAVRDARTTYGATGKVHLFFSGPVGLAMMLGQLFNTFPQIATYEYGSDQDPPYRPAAIIINP